jgi:hypothetical protein
MHGVAARLKLHALNLPGKNPLDHCRADTGCAPPPLPWDTSTMKPGRSSVSAPKPYKSHDPMLGRPFKIEPLFMKAWAGSWLICSVTIERTMQMSSAIPPMCGKSSLISWPDLPHCLKANDGPRAISCAPCNCANCCPFVNDSGNGWPCSLASIGLLSNVSNCDGPPAMHRWMMRLTRTGKCGFAITPRARPGAADLAPLLPGAANASLLPNREPSAMPPNP